MPTNHVDGPEHDSGAAEYERKISSYLEEVRSISRELRYYPYLARLADQLEGAFSGLVDCVIIEIASKERRLAECRNEIRKLIERSATWKKLRDI